MNERKIGGESMADTKRVAPDPRDKVRECSCGDGRRAVNLDDGLSPNMGTVVCLDCDGRGYVVGRWVGYAGADIEIASSERGRWQPARSQDVIEVEQGDDGRFWAWFCPLGPFPTEAEAILAARCAYLGVEVSQVAPHGWYWGLTGLGYEHKRDGLNHGRFNTPEAALIAAIEAKGEK